ncbi:uncharacterized protein LOC124818207 [Hydra vulgaris]|uniref:uncharacterized protein LOC124818207 n=1 Tax=Hydra vulgaris TaxID=6087 RepID=UPI001F5E92CD|nr:uncharacterized protein LOC124818207 [Hydra vulgaris]
MESSLKTYENGNQNRVTYAKKVQMQPPIIENREDWKKNDCSYMRFWDNICKIKTKATTRLFTINKSQSIKDIVQEFRQHFQTLLNTPLILNNNHNPSQIPSLSKEPNSLIITSADIINCISQLNSDKSPDSYGLSAEHLKNYHNNNLLLWLAKFYNSILSNGKVPNDLSTSTIIPLVKSYKKSLNNPDNYRGISILPIVTKLLEYLILRICPSITDSHSHQFGFKKKQFYSPRRIFTERNCYAL